MPGSLIAGCHIVTSFLLYKVTVVQNTLVNSVYSGLHAIRYLSDLRTLDAGV